MSIFTESSSHDYSVYKLVDQITNRILSKISLGRVSTKNIHKMLRIQSSELLFLFQKGPHKYVGGALPLVTSGLYQSIFDLITSSMLALNMQCEVNKLRHLVEKVPKNADTYAILIFLLLISDFDQSSSEVGTFRIPLQETNIHRAKPHSYTTFQSADMFGSVRLPQVLCRSDFTNPAPMIPRFSSSVNESVFNEPTLSYNHVKSKPSYFSSAFTKSGTDINNKNLNLSRNSILTKPLSFAVAPSLLGQNISRLPTILRSKQYDDDEGYSESMIKFSSLAIDDECAASIVTRLFSRSSEVAQFLLKRIFMHTLCCSVSNNHEANLLINKELQDLLPVNDASSTYRYCWEERGRPQPFKEAPFLSESGPLSVKALLDLQESRFGFLTPSGDVDKDLVAKQVHKDELPLHSMNDESILKQKQSFIRDLFLMRLGIPSHRFVLSVLNSPSTDNEEMGQSSADLLKRIFQWLPCELDIIALGLSSNSLSCFLKSHLLAGTYFRQLTWFTKNTIKFDSYRSDLICRSQIWVCFIQVIRKWLCMYEQAIQDSLNDFVSKPESGHIGLVSLNEKLRNLTEQIYFVADLCMFGDTNSDCPNCPLLKLSGVELLAYMLTKSNESVCHSNEQLIRYIFAYTIQPFIKFLEVFTVDGLCENALNEFSVVVSNENICDKGFKLPNNNFQFIPSLHELSVDKISDQILLSALLPCGFEDRVLRCAKSIQLLKSIAPKHFLLKLRSHFPKLQFPYNIDQIVIQKQAFQDYMNILAEQAIQNEATRKQKITKLLAKRQEFLNEVARLRALRLATIEAKRLEIVHHHQAKQRAQLAELKLAAEQEFQRRQESIRLEKEADRKLIQSIIKSEQYREEIINEVKSEMEAYYQNLFKSIDLRRIEAEKQIEQSKLLSEVLDADSVKVFEFKANSSVSPPVDTGLNFSLTNKTEDKSNRLNLSIDSKSNSNNLNDLNVDKVPNSNTKSSDQINLENKLLPTDDLLNVLQKKFKQTNVDSFGTKDNVSDLIYGEKKSMQIKNSFGLDINSSVVEESRRNVFSEVDRFKQINVHGHSSDSTIQHILYGKGLGPASRPSEWEAQRLEEDKLRALTQNPQPDAVSFYKEALESNDTENHDPYKILVKPFTKDFPSFDQITALKPFLWDESKNLNDQYSSEQVLDLHKIKSDLIQIPLRVLIDRTIVNPLNSFIDQVDVILCNHFIFNLNLMDHFKCLREICFLENGTFGQLFLTPLFRESTESSQTHSSIYNSNHIYNLLKSTVNDLYNYQTLIDPSCKLNFQTGKNSNIHSVKLFNTHMINNIIPITITKPTTNKLLKETNIYLQNSTLDLLKNYLNIVIIHHTTNKGAVSNRNIDDDYQFQKFNHLNIVYDPPWPINIFFNSNIIKKYNQIFHLFIQLKYSIWLLNLCKINLKQSILIKSTTCTYMNQTYKLNELIGLSNNFHQINLWLYELNQIMTNLATYLSNQVVHVKWSEFLKQLGLPFIKYDDLLLYNRNNNINNNKFMDSEYNIPKSLDKLCEIHETYLDDILRCCLLDSTETDLSQALFGLFDCVYKFHGTLYNGQWSVENSKKFAVECKFSLTSQLFVIYRNFQQFSRFLNKRINRLLIFGAPKQKSDNCSQTRLDLIPLNLVFGLNNYYTTFHPDSYLRQTNS